MNKVLLNDPYHVVDLDLINDNSIIVDVGAAIGKFVKEIRKYNEKCKIFCIEPSKYNLENIKIDDMCVLIPKVLVGENREVIYKEFRKGDTYDGEYDYFGYWGNIMNLNTNHPHVSTEKLKLIDYKVDTITLSDLISEYNIESIDYLKLAIEGSEYEVIKSIDEELSNKIKQISILTHMEEKNKPMVEHLEKLGFKVDYCDKEEYYAYK